MLATPFASVVPKELAGDDATAFSAKPVGTGPYLLKSYTKGQGATFVKNPAYWQAGQPYLDQIDYKTGQDDNAMLLQIEAGTLDMMGDPLPAAQFTDVTTNPDYADQIYHHTLVDTDYVFMDTQHARTTARSATSRSARRSTTPSTRRPSCRSATAPASRPTASTRPTCPATTPRATRIRTTSRRPRR